MTVYEFDSKFKVDIQIHSINVRLYPLPNFEVLGNLHLNVDYFFSINYVFEKKNQVTKVAVGLGKEYLCGVILDKEVPRSRRDPFSNPSTFDLPILFDIPMAKVFRCHFSSKQPLHCDASK